MEAAVQKGEEKGVRRGQCQTCLGDREHLLRARDALCHLWDWEEMVRARHGGLDTQGDSADTASDPYTAAVVFGTPKQTVL